MKNILKSIYSLKSLYDKNTKTTFIDQAHIEEVDSISDSYLQEEPKKDLKLFGLPKLARPYYNRPSYSFGYDFEKRSPLWVLDKIEPSDFEVTTHSNEHNEITCDMDVRPFEARMDDFINDQRGLHAFTKKALASPQHHRNNHTDYESCFFPTNFIPINKAVDHNIHIPLVNYVTDLAKKYDTWVYSGPIWEIKKEISSDFNVMSYKILNFVVAYPTAFFMIIVTEIKKEPHMACVVAQNDTSLGFQETTLDRIEELTGLQMTKLKNFYPKKLFEKVPFKLGDKIFQG